MTKGTPSMGKKSGKKSHFRCRRCGEHTFHFKTGICSSCGYGKTTKIRSYAWMKKKTLTHS
ncbi:50S ribosomal protein L37e [Candidatus Woesearchaeota archaeon]|nr:50S ribosomal protein L37e [Candidatus Woesearchaeota archaeon]